MFLSNIFALFKPIFHNHFLNILIKKSYTPQELLLFFFKILLNINIHNHIILINIAYSIFRIFACGVYGFYEMFLGASICVGGLIMDKGCDILHMIILLRIKGQFKQKKRFIYADNL